jgi:biopolymer transport protein ExbD
MRLPPSEPEFEGPNMTPVIDVVFLLLIFFLVATRFDREERELPTEHLPEVVQAQPMTMTKQVIVNVTRDGKYRVSGKEFTEKQLAKLLQDARRVNPDVSVLIYGDGESAWKYGVRVMSFCNWADIKKYRVAALEKQ